MPDPGIRLGQDGPESVSVLCRPSTRTTSASGSKRVPAKWQRAGCPAPSDAILLADLVDSCKPGDEIVSAQGRGGCVGTVAGQWSALCCWAELLLGFSGRVTLLLSSALSDQGPWGEARWGSHQAPGPLTSRLPGATGIYHNNHDGAQHHQRLSPLCHCHPGQPRGQEGQQGGRGRAGLTRT